MSPSSWCFRQWVSTGNVDYLTLYHEWKGRGY
ncbi:hypothetical protein [Escherichia phage vB_EcoP_LHP]